VPANVIVQSIRFKVREQVEITESLIRLLSPECLKWRPQAPSDAMDVGHLLGHVLDCLAGFCAVFQAAFPDLFHDLEHLRSLPVNHFCPPEEAIDRIHLYAATIERGFDLCTDEDLSRMLRTAFASSESITTLLLGNLEHIINHKHQLFLYMKLLGLPVATRDLYRFRGEAAAVSS
jgi:hypothetical protein